MLCNLVKWSKVGGYLLMNFPAEEIKDVVITGWMGEKGWVYLNERVADQYRDLVEDTGLEVVLDEEKQDHVKAEALEFSPQNVNCKCAPCG